MNTNTVDFKPWNSFEKQLNKLVANGLTINNKTKASDYLARLGYYRLSGYWYPLREMDFNKSAAQKKAIRTSRFLPNSTFENVVRLYVFDKKLRLMAMDALERIEMAVRVDIAYLLGSYDPLAHKLPKYLHGHFAKKIQLKGADKGLTEHQKWLQKYEMLLARARREPFIEHNNKKYGEPPIWAAIEVWDFGLMSKLYAGMRITDQDKIAAKYGAENGKELAHWLRSLNFIRNVSAHHSRLWNINILERCPLPTNEPNWQGLENKRPFLYFCIMQKMLNVLCPNSSWGNRFIGLLDEFPQNAGFKIEDFGMLPEKWVEKHFNSQK